MAEESAAGQLANLHLDELTGEMVRYEATKSIQLSNTDGAYSKTELKKRQKQRATEDKKKEKKEKAAAAPPKAGRGISAEEEESNLTPNVCCLACSLKPSNRNPQLTSSY